MYIRGFVKYIIYENIYRSYILGKIKVGSQSRVFRSSGLMGGRVKLGSRDLGGGLIGGRQGSWRGLGSGILGVNPAVMGSAVVIRSISAGCVIIMCHYAYVIIMGSWTYYFHPSS